MVFENTKISTRSASLLFANSYMYNNYSSRGAFSRWVDCSKSRSNWTKNNKVIQILYWPTQRGPTSVAVLRFVNSFEIKQYLVRFQTFAGEEIARELISTLSGEYGIIKSI